MKIIQLGGKAGSNITEFGFNYLFKTMGIEFRLDHVGRGNAGDTAIGTSFRYLFRNEFPDSKVSFMNCRKIFTQKDIDHINKADVLFVSGGGLFLYDTFENVVSDWQWGISKELLDKINVPVIVYSIGYNKFRKQLEFNNYFDETVNKLIEKSIFFSLRNSGSCNAIKNHIDKKFHKYVKLNYCPTMLLSRKFGFKNTIDNKSVGFVLAGDRLKNRHEDINKFIEHIKIFVEYLKNNGIETVLLNHSNDTWIGRYVKFNKFVNLHGRDSRYIYKTYSKIDVVVGDRGHSQMIPFACGCKILTPISHDKLKWFLEDMGLEEFGVEENDEKLSEKMIDEFSKLNNIDWDRIQKERMQMIYKINRNNLEFIKQRLQEEERG